LAANSSPTGLVEPVRRRAPRAGQHRTRLLVQRDIHDALVERVAARAIQIKLGDPQDPGTEMGPVAFRGHLDKVLGMVEAARAEGARLVTGGARPLAPGLADGFFVEPTLFADVSNDMTIAREEVFGP